MRYSELSNFHILGPPAALLRIYDVEFKRKNGRPRVLATEFRLLD